LTGVCAAIVVVAIFATTAFIRFAITIPIARVETGISCGTLWRSVRCVGRASTPKPRIPNLGGIREIAVSHATATRCTPRTSTLLGTGVVGQWPRQIADDP
jgi:hypothetical protein